MSRACDIFDKKYDVFDKKKDRLLRKCNKIWDKVSNNVKKGFDIEPVYNEIYLKTKIKSYKGKNYTKIS